MSDRITITTGARLHWGLFSDPRPGGRRFQGLGAMLAEPSAEVAASFASASAITAPAAYEAPLKAAVSAVLKWMDEPSADESGSASTRAVHTSALSANISCGSAARHLRVELRTDLPPHAGFGSGTQIALAAAKAVTTLLGRADVGVEELAQVVARGRRSSIGIAGFSAGGLLVDAGHAPDALHGQVLTRRDLPAEWRVILITPRVAGLHGSAENQAIAALPPLAVEQVLRLESLIHDDILPALETRTFATFANAVTEFGAQIGAWFRPVQGDLYALPFGPAIADALQQAGARGWGQSSWGPTIFALCEHPDEAATVLERLTCRLPRDIPCDLRSVSFLNHGATIQESRTGG